MPGLKTWSFQDNGVANGNGGIYGPFQFNCLGLVFLGWTSPQTNNPAGPSLNNAQIRVHPGKKPQFLTGNGSVYPGLAVDGIPLTAGQFFRLKDIESNWYFSILPEGSNEVRTFWFAQILDECFTVGTLSLLTPPSSLGSSTGSNAAAALQLASPAPATLRGYYLFNEDATTTFLQFFDTNNPASVTLGVTPPVLSLGVPPGAGANVAGIVRDFTSGIVIAATTTRNGAVAPAAPLDWNLFL